MLRNLMFSMASLVLMVSTVSADDSEFNLDLDSISDAKVEIVEASLDVDVDSLASEADGESTEDAIEASFRRFYGGHHYGYRNWSYYRPYFRPYYSYSHGYSHGYSSFYGFQPIYHYAYAAAPVYRYFWGCY